MTHVTKMVEVARGDDWVQVSSGMAEEVEVFIQLRGGGVVELVAATASPALPIAADPRAGRPAGKEKPQGMLLRRGYLQHTFTNLSSATNVYARVRGGTKKALLAVVAFQNHL